MDYESPVLGDRLIRALKVWGPRTNHELPQP